jgi:DNA mismatch repair protein MutS
MVHSHDFYTLYQKTYEKYTALYGQVCVFLQKGSFYEIYGQQDSQTLNQLNTGREVLDLLSLQIHTYPEDGPNKTTGFYGGVPVYTLDKWASKLTTSGWSVVVIDEIKNGAGKVTSREVSKVLSAGTHLDSADSTKSFFVASLWIETRIQEPPLFGVAAADLTTGQVFLYEGTATGKADVWHTDDLRHFFQVHPPRELLLFLRGIPTYIEEETLRRTLYIPKAPIHIKQASSEQQGALENKVAREEYLQRLFQPRTALPFRTWLRCSQDGTSRQERALATLLRFAEDHAPKLAECLQAPGVWHPTQNLQVINNALTQLNLIGNQEQPCVEDLFAKPLTAMGKRSLTGRLCSPLSDADRILKRQTEIDWILNNKDFQKDIETGLTSIYDISRLHRSIIKGTVKANDIIQLHQSYQSILLLWKSVQASPFSECTEIQTSTNQCLTAFLTEFDVAKAIRAQDKEGELGFLLDSVGKRSADAEKRVAEIYEAANEWLQTFLDLVDITRDSVYFRPTEKNMFCIHTSKNVLKTIESSVKNIELGIYKGITFKSLTSAGRIEHNALERFQEQLDSAKSTLTRCLESEVAISCIRFSSATRHFWQPLEDWVTSLDLSFCMAKTARQQGWIKPTIETDKEGSSRLQIENLRHPLIENQKRQSKYVTHNISLGYEDVGQGWLLYGMNASGKSSLMKAIGLATLLAQIGSYVPATKMTLKPFHKIATRILNQDNLWAGLSSFAVEMSELREILAVADDRTLVLGDELCAGTESISGTAIVAAGIQHLYKCGSRFVLATHLHDLMKLPQVTMLKALKIWHLHVEYDPVRDLLVYHRALKEGAGSSMYGLEVAKALHLPRDMIDAAFEMRHTLLGSSAIEEAKSSAWNADTKRLICSACGDTYKEKLEVHHIQERSEAKGGRNKDGTALNHRSNLTTLCEKCHDKHHSGELYVGPLEDTSEGPKRAIIDFSKYKHKESETKKQRSIFSDEQVSKMKELVKITPGLTPRLWCFQIRSELEIEITEAQFKSLQKKGLIA